MGTPTSWHRLVSEASVVPGPLDSLGSLAPLGGATLLSQQLHRDDSPKAGPLDAFRIARRTFVAGERVDMGPLADALGVDRATLFRWVGNRDQLLTEVIWSVNVPTWQAALDAAEAAGVTGAERVVVVFDGFVRAVIGATFFRTYLQREGQRALRLLTTRAGQHQARVAARFEALLRAEVAASGLALPLPAHDLAYVLTRVAESFVYADLIVGEEPDATKAAAVVGAVLGAPRPLTPP